MYTIRQQNYVQNHINHMSIVSIAWPPSHGRRGAASAAAHLGGPPRTKHTRGTLLARRALPTTPAQLAYGSQQQEGTPSRQRRPLEVVLRPAQPIQVGGMPTAPEPARRWPASSAREWLQVYILLLDGAFTALPVLSAVHAPGACTASRQAIERSLPGSTEPGLHSSGLSVRPFDRDVC